ncbi:hypothetical protein pb186bvf_020469 [Paramecium bursaria]
MLIALFILITKQQEITVFHDNPLQNQILIVSKLGKIYNYDLKYQQFRWLADLNVMLESTAYQNGSYSIKPFKDGSFIINDMDQYYKVSSEEIDLMFKQCEFFKNSVTYSNTLIYFLDVISGNLKQLTQYDIHQILTQPVYYRSGVVVSIDQRYISELDYEDTFQHTSRININFLLKHLRGIPTTRKFSQNITIYNHISQLEAIYENKKIFIDLDEESYEIFAFDEVDGIFSLELNQTIVDGIVPFKKFDCLEEQCFNEQSNAVKLFQESPIKQCMAQIYSFKRQQNQIQVYKTDTCDTNDVAVVEKSIHVYYIGSIMTLILLFGASFKFRKEPPPKLETQIQVIKEVLQKEEITINKQVILGVGMYGTVVYEGKLQGKKVAVKQIKKNIISEHNLNQIVKREIEIQKHLNSPFIVRVLWHEETQKYIKIALEQCLVNVREIIEIDKTKRLEQIQVQKMQGLLNSELFHQKFLYSCIMALNILHENNIIHRDIRPDNILITEDGQVKVADFGLSKIIDTHKHTQNSGSIGWRAREVILNQNYSIKSDVFSLGCVFYYLISKGNHPFGKNNVETKIVEDKPIKFKLPPDQQNILESLISKTNRKFPNEYLNHPYFWSKQKKLLFLCEFSDYLETYDVGQAWNAILQVKKDDVFKDTWGLYAPEMIRNLERKYDQTSFKQLIRYIRNSKNHYHELKDECKKVLGETDDTFFEYWDKCYPNLFFTLYQFAIDNKFQMLILK